MTDPDRLIPQRLRDPNVPANSEGTVPYADPLPAPAEDPVLETARESSQPEWRSEAADTDAESR